MVTMAIMATMVMVIIIIISSSISRRAETIMAASPDMAGMTTARWWPTSGAGSGSLFY